MFTEGDSQCKSPQRMFVQLSQRDHCVRFQNLTPVKKDGVASQSFPVTDEYREVRQRAESDRWRRCRIRAQCEKQMKGGESK